MSGGLHFLELQGCSLAYPEIDDDTYVTELILTYKCGEQCDYCSVNNHVPYSLPRTMTLKRAVESVSEGMALARDAGKKRLRVQITGREPFDGFERVKEIYDAVTALNSDISLGIDTCGYAVTDEIKEWLKTTDIRLALRWHGDTRDRVWLSDADLWKRQTEVIIWSVPADNFSLVGKDADFLYKCHVPVLMELCKMDQLTKSSLWEYFEEIKKPLAKARTMRFAIRGYNGCETGERRVTAFDTDGEKYICRHLSPLRQIPSVYESSYLTGENESGCSKCGAFGMCAVCPAAAAIKNSKQCNILQMQSVYIKKIEERPHFKGNMI